MASSATRTVHPHRAQPGTFTRRREVNHDSTSRWRKRLMILSKVLATSVLFVVISSLSVIGAYLNHVRGDGADVTGTYWYHHIMSRLVFAIPTAAVMTIFAVNWRPFPIVLALTTCSLFVGWGCYFDVAFQKDGYKSRSGVFDWLLGRQAIHWSQQEVFFHNFAGMALRGLVWTAPQGYILYHLGYGWQHSLSGSLMSTVYAVGYLIPTYKHLAVGTGWSEVLWGYWVWLVMIFSALAGLLETLRETHGGHSGHTKQTPPYLSSFISKRWLAILFEVWNGVLCSLFIFSTTFYAFVQQKDVRNKGQTFFGMIVVSLVMLAAQLVVLTAVWVTQKKDIDLTYELRGVAILCNSPLILRNKVRFSPHRFGTQPNDTVEGQQFLPYHPADTDSHHWDDVREQRPRDLGFESDASEQQGIRSRNRLGLASEVMDDTPQNDLTDAEAEDFVDWSQVFAEASESRLELWVRKIPFELWSFAEKHIYTSMPAAIRLVLGLISLLACVATTCITIAITCWNIKGQRFLVACNCTQ